MTTRPQVVLSVVIPTYNRRERLERVLKSLANQEIDEPFEVVVVSDGSTDGTDEYLRSDRLPIPVRALSQPNQGPAAARNRGVENVCGAIVVFLDDDVVADRRLLRAHFDAHQRYGPRAVVIGPMLNPPDHQMSVWVAWEQEMLAKQYDALTNGRYEATARQFYTGNASLRTDVFREAGGFNTGLRRAEDVELAFRLDDLGVRFHFEPSARGLHYAERSYDSWRQTAYVYGRNDVIFARDLNRRWLFEFIKEAFGWQNPAIRMLVNRSNHSAASRHASIQSLDRLIRTRYIHPASLRQRVTRYALSGVYAIEYYGGVADELGSPEAFDRLIEQGERLLTEHSS